MAESEITEDVLDELDQRERVELERWRVRLAVAPPDKEGSGG